MKNNNTTFQFSILAIMIVAAAATRFLPHPPNFTPIGAMGLFGAAYFNKKINAFLIPIAAVWLSDLILNNVIYAAYMDGFTWITTGSLFVYMAFALIVLIGMGLLKKVTPSRVIGGSVLASLVFFLVSNFGVWATTTMYPKTSGGLMAAYTAGLPFFWNTVASNLLFSVILFGVYAYINKKQIAFARY